MAYLIIAALVFAICYAVDKGFSKLFRGQKQHKSGKAVKLNKRYALFGLLLTVLGTVGVFTGIGNGPVLLIGSILVLVMAVGLVAYYLSFGIYYDADSFLYSAFSRKTVSYRYDDIRAQKLYVIQGGSMVVELHMADGRAVSLQTSMDGAYPFLDHAFARWCEQRGITAENCQFHDPSQHQWFPDAEVQ